MSFVYSHIAMRVLCFYRCKIFAIGFIIFKSLTLSEETFARRNFRAQKLSQEKLLRPDIFANELIVHFACINFREWKICVFSFSLSIVLIIGVDTKKHLLRYTIAYTLEQVGINYHLADSNSPCNSPRVTKVSVHKVSAPIIVPYPEIIWTHQFFNADVPGVEKTS